MTAKHFSDGKRRVDLVPAEWVDYLAEVLGQGSEKYGPWNWAQGGSYTSYVASMIRHTNAYRKGEYHDPESGKPHLTHVAVNALMLSTWEEYRLGENDLHRFYSPVRRSEMDAHLKKKMDAWEKIVNMPKEELLDEDVEDHRDWLQQHDDMFRVFNKDVLSLRHDIDELHRQTHKSAFMDALDKVDGISKEDEDMTNEQIIADAVTMVIQAIEKKQLDDKGTPEGQALSELAKYINENHESDDDLEDDDEGRVDDLYDKVLQEAVEKYGSDESPIIRASKPEINREEPVVHIGAIQPRPDILVYTAGPYTGKDREETTRNIEKSRTMGRRIINESGAYPVIPQSNTPGIEFEQLAEADFFYTGTMTLMHSCHAVLMLPGWQHSMGAMNEREEARIAGIPTFHSMTQLRDWVQSQPVT